MAIFKKERDVPYYKVSRNVKIQSTNTFYRGWHSFCLLLDQH